MKIIYFGSSGPLSLVPLQHLLASGHTVSAIALRTERQPVNSDVRLSVIADNAESIESLALANEIPLIALRHSLASSGEELAAFAPDLVLASCFAERLPRQLLSVPVRGCFNLHPSLLPAYRGPAPVFWQFRDGVSCFGVTLHRMSERLDAGNIVAQARVSLPDGVSARQADQHLAQAGARLLVGVLDRLQQGMVVGTPQDEEAASYQGLPGVDDFRVSTAWPARRLYNFIRGTSNRGLPYACEIGGVVYHLAEVDAFRAEGKASPSITGRQITIPCSPGMVKARLRD